MLLLAEGASDGGGDHGGDHAGDGVLNVHAVQHLLALAVDDLPLLVHDVVVLQGALAGLEVSGFHAGLGVLNGPGEHLVLQGHVLPQIQPVHEAGDPFPAEKAYQIVVQAQVEPGLAGVALSAGAAPKLVVDAAGVVALSADDEEAPRRPDLVRLPGDLRFVLGQTLGEELSGVQDLLIVRLGVAGGLGDELIGEARFAQVVFGHELGVAAQHDVGAAARHVGCHSDGPQLAGLGHDLRLALVVLGVQEVVLDARLLQQLAEMLVLLNGHGAHQHRLALAVTFLDLLDDGPVLGVLGLIDHVGVVLAGQGAVGGNLHDIQLVDGAELLLLREGGTGHAGELVVQTEVVLEGDGGQSLALPLHLHPLLGLDGLVQALAVPAAEHEAAGELVHDDHLTVLEDVVDVPLHDAVGLDGLVDVVGQGGVFRVGQVLHMEELLRLFDASGGEGGGASLLVHHIVGVQIHVLLGLLVGLGDDQLLQGADKHLRHVVHLGGLLPHAGDDEGGPGLVDEDGVHLVHDGEIVAPLDQLLAVEGHVVPQVVEAHLVVGAVGDVGGVGLLPLLLVQIVDDEAHAEAQEAVDLAHPLAVALGQVVVDGDDVDALSGEGVEVSGQGGHQRFALAGLHLGDAALVQHHAAHQLYPVGPQAQHPDAGLPHGGEGLGQQIVQGLPLGEAGFKLRRFSSQLLVGQRLELGFQGLDLVHDGIDGLQLPVAVGTE